MLPRHVAIGIITRPRLSSPGFMSLRGQPRVTWRQRNFHYPPRELSLERHTSLPPRQFLGSPLLPKPQNEHSVQIRDANRPYHPGRTQLALQGAEESGVRNLRLSVQNLSSPDLSVPRFATYICRIFNKSTLKLPCSCFSACDNDDAWSPTTQ